MFLTIFQKYFIKLSNLVLQIKIQCGNIIRHEIWVWLSLVERLNGVQEAAGSTPVTQTSQEPQHYC